MEIETLVYGIYPKSEKLRRIISRYERNQVSTSDLALEFQAEKEEIIKRLTSLGINYFSDPILNWYDLFRPLALILEGTYLGPLTRYRETNTFYRIPIINDISRKKVSYEKLFEGKENPPTELFSPPVSNRHLAILPGAHSFYGMSEVRDGITEKAFSEHISEMYSSILEKYGYTGAVIYDPLEYGDSSLEYLNPLMEKYSIYLVTSGKLRRQNFARTNGKLASVIVDPSRDNYALAAEQSEIPGLKVIDTGNTLIETNRIIADAISDSVGNEKIGKIIIANNESLDFLPRQVADRKVSFMSGLGA
jgi:5-methyltetrahydropteroyltriglutamate--homocysteine methyltransferase